MSLDLSGLVALETVGSSFEAETIAEALRARGIPAEVFGGQLSRTVHWEIGNQAAAKVMVRRGDLDAADAALALIRKESAAAEREHASELEPPATLKFELPEPEWTPTKRRVTMVIYLLLLVMLGGLAVNFFAIVGARL